MTPSSSPGPMNSPRSSRGPVQLSAAAHLKSKPSKCGFLRNQADHLGQFVSEDGIQTDKNRKCKVLVYSEE